MAPGRGSRESSAAIANEDLVLSREDVLDFGLGQHDGKRAADGFNPDADVLASRASGLMTDADGLTTAADRLNPDADVLASRASGLMTDAGGLTTAADRLNPDADVLASRASGLMTDADGLTTDADGLNPDADVLASRASGLTTDAVGLTADGIRFAGLVSLDPPPRKAGPSAHRF